MRTYLSLLALLLSRQAFAQLSVGSSGMAVLSGTTPAVDGLALTPTSNLTIASNSLQRTTLWPITSASTDSISSAHLCFTRVKCNLTT